MDIWQESILIGLVLGVIMAIWVAPRSAKKDAIRGGSMAQVFHFIGAALFSAVLPTVLVSLILRGGFGVAFPLAIGLLVLAYVALLGYAVFEKPARAQVAPDEELWTAEKAKSSGL